MNVIQLGPFILNFQILMLIIAAFTSYLAVKYRIGQLDVDRIIIDKYVNAFILTIIIWKMSIIIFDPISVIEQPISLLYFNGGDKGLWLGLLTACIYLYIRSRKDGTSLMMNLDVLSIAWITGSSMYHLLILIVDRTSILFHLLYVISNITIGLLYFVKKQSIGQSTDYTRYFMWYSLMMLGVYFVEQGRITIIYGFTMVQLLFLAIFIFCMIWDNILDRRKSKE
ncbi:hypothetical protein [Paenibacillus sp. CMAA1364]